MARGSGTRELIIDAARAVLLNKGLVRATTDEIARTAGVSKGTIYNHFSNKEELFRYTLNELPSGFVRLMRGLHERVGTETVPAVLSRVAAALEFYAKAVPMGASLSPTRN